MKQRKVVTSFLTFSESADDPTGQGNRVLLLKRSNKVNTYKQHWAGISGGMEINDNSPLERALIEIQEETTLSSSDIKLIRIGKPLNIRDENNSIIWKVYPFLFHIKSDNIPKIKIDWEHETFKWVNPKELSSYNTVPNLLETFYRVYLPNNLHLGLIDMFTDRSSGAQQLVNKALDIFSETIENKSCHEYSQCSKDLYINYLNIGWHLCEIRPNMKASTLYAIISIMQQCKKSLDQNLSMDSFDNQVLNIIKTMKILSNDSEQKINTNFITALFPKFVNQSLHIMTMSYSSTIFSVLINFIKNYNQKALKNLECSKTLTITILEFRPLNEGAILGQKLLSMLPQQDENIIIQIITDSSCNFFMPTVTHVLLGADRILGHNGTVINKIGSVPLALAAKHHGKPLYIVSRTDKILGEYDNEKIEENDSSEVTKIYGDQWKDNKNLLVRNVYFEKLESDLITGYVTEVNSKLLMPIDIQNLWNERKSLESIFDDLEEEIQYP
ncbi:15313_t:CDS:2 [Gigaspora margarita]|uniref:15313_t:CDS:1 n=1 Tax=Gigaspora margarita TaxID=4874 RepID=A0ABN7V6J3_GIGMA|nr:15313_t:CDS:2 [Gigaspora margarita]